MSTTVEAENIFARNIVMEEITHVSKEMSGSGSFIQVTDEGKIIPVYADQVLALYLLMNWPFLPGVAAKNHNDENNSAGLSLYAVLLPHGKVFVVEVFFLEEKTGKYLGSTRLFRISFPNHQYTKDYDEWLMNELASRTLGLPKEEQSVLNAQFFEKHL